MGQSVVRRIASSSTIKSATDAANRDLLTGLSANDLVWVDDDTGSADPAVYRVTAVTDGAWATSTKIRLASGASDVSRGNALTDPNIFKLHIDTSMPVPQLYMSESGSWTQV